MLVRCGGMFICQVSSCLGLEARIDVHHRHEAAEQQTGSGRDRDGERDFGDHECGARAASECRSRRLPRLASCRLACGLMSPSSAPAARPTRRPVRIVVSDADQQHAPVDRDFVDARDVGRRQRDERLVQRRPHHAADRAIPAGGREQQAFGEQLSRDPRPASAQRGASRKLLFTGDAARQQQVRDVHRRHDQHERDAGEQDQQRRTDRRRPSDRSMARRWRPSPCSCSGYACSSCAAIASGRLPLAATATPALTRPMAPHQWTLRTTCPLAVSIRFAAAAGSGEGDRQPHVDAGDAREPARPEHAAVREHEIGRHHADHLERHPVERQLPADDARIAAEAPPPVAVAQHHDRRCSLAANARPSAAERPSMLNRFGVT